MRSQPCSKASSISRQWSMANGQWSINRQSNPNTIASIINVKKLHQVLFFISVCARWGVTGMCFYDMLVCSTSQKLQQDDIHQYWPLRGIFRSRFYQTALCSQWLGRERGNCCCLVVFTSIRSSSTFSSPLSGEKGDRTNSTDKCFA